MPAVLYLVLTWMGWLSLSSFSVMRQLIYDNAEGLFNSHKISQVINGRSRIQIHRIDSKFYPLSAPTFCEVQLLLARIHKMLGSLCYGYKYILLFGGEVYSNFTWIKKFVTQNTKRNTIRHSGLNNSSWTFLQMVSLHPSCNSLTLLLRISKANKIKLQPNGGLTCTHSSHSLVLLPFFKNSYWLFLIGNACTHCKIQTILSFKRKSKKSKSNFIQNLQ